MNEKIKELRLQKGLTQKELSKILIVPQSLVARWESGVRTPTVDSIKKLVVFFDVTADEFFDMVTAEKREQIYNLLNL